MANPNPNRSGLTAFRADYQPKHPSKQRQLTAMQHVLFDIVISGEGEVRERANAACAWERLQNRLDRMRMKPEPKPIDVQAKPSKQRLAILDVEPSESKAG